jgi:hypothetical protein
MTKVKRSFASSFCNKSDDKIKRKGANSCLSKSSSTSHYPYPGSFAEEEPTTAHQQPKSTVCSPPHVLNPPRHRPVVRLPKWLHIDIPRCVPVNSRTPYMQTEQSNVYQVVLPDLPGLPGQIEVPSAGDSHIASIRRSVNRVESPSVVTCTANATWNCSASQTETRGKQSKHVMV